MKESRQGYEFTLEQKELARERAGGSCEYPKIPCPEPNTNQVNHFTGIHLGKLLDIPRETITSDDNNLLLCDSHQRDLDRQEATLVYSIEHPQLDKH